MGTCPVFLHWRDVPNHLSGGCHTFTPQQSRFLIKRNLIEIWIQDSTDEDAKITIGENLRKLLNMDYHNLTFFFKQHHQSL